MNRHPFSFFVTATDTEAGKTVAAAALALHVKQQGLSVAVMKPIATGALPSTIKSDAAFHQEILGYPYEKYELLNPCRFRAPLSPYAASLLEKKSISIKKILKAYHTLCKKYDVVIVEGIGGLLVPIKKNYFVADLAKEMKLPLLIVARPGLGTLNHTLMTIKTAQSYKLPVAGIIFNHAQKPVRSLSEKTNEKILQKLTSIPVLGTLPYAHETNLQKGILGRKLQNAAKKLILKLMDGHS